VVDHRMAVAECRGNLVAGEFRILTLDIGQAAPAGELVEDNGYRDSGARNDRLAVADARIDFDLVHFKVPDDHLQPGRQRPSSECMATHVIRQEPERGDQGCFKIRDRRVQRVPPACPHAGGGRPEDRPPLPGVRGGVAFRNVVPDLETALRGDEDQTGHRRLRR